MANMNASFDPWTQNFTIILPNGRTPLIAHMTDIAIIQQSAVNTSIAQSIQIGAAVILLLTLLLITKGEKMRSAVFLLNASSLLLVVLRGIFALYVTTGPFYDFYRFQTGDYMDTGNARALSVAGEIMSVLLTIAIQLSLVTQVRIVCCNLEAWKSHIINTVNMFAVFVAIAIRVALMAVDIDWNIVHLDTETASQFATFSKLASAANITLVISIAISTIIFCAKLGFAIESRRTMGMTQFGPMQIIFVMGCQTMCTPLIFTIIVYWGVKYGQITSFVPTVVALSLPLSAMWATCNTSNLQQHVNLRAIPVGNPGLDTGKSFGSSTTNSTVITKDTLVDDGSTGVSPKKRLSVRMPRFSGGAGRSEDVEMGRLTEDREAEGVYVNRTYSVRSG